MFINPTSIKKILNKNFIQWSTENIEWSQIFILNTPKMGTVAKNSTKGSKKVGKLSKRRASVSPDVHFMNILLDSMLKNDD